MANDAPTKERRDNEEQLDEPRGVSDVGTLNLQMQHFSFVDDVKIY